MINPPRKENYVKIPMEDDQDAKLPKEVKPAGDDPRVSKWIFYVHYLVPGLTKEIIDYFRKRILLQQSQKVNQKKLL